MKTIIEGRTPSTICITTDCEQDIIPCENSLIKLWLSSGTILCMKYGSKLFPNKWSMRILCGPADKNYVYRQCVFNSTWDPRLSSDSFETDEEVISYQLIPNTYYGGKEVDL